MNPRIDRIAAAALIALAVAPAAAMAQNGGALPAVNGRVASIRFFEMGAEVPALSDRRFSKQFDRASSRYIATQLDLEMPAPGREIDLPIQCTYAQPDGTEMGAVDLSMKVQPDWTRPFYARGRGWADPGNWKIGTYKVTCTHDGQTVAEDSFEIVDGPPTMPSVDAKLGVLRFYGSDGSAVPREQRQYTSSFATATAKYINLELQLAHEPLGRVGNLAIGCPLVRDDGTLVTTLQFSLEIQPEWRNTYTSTGWGTANGGWWKPGTYRVYCIAEGNLIGETFFTVTQ